MATRNLFVRAGFDASGMISGTRQANNALRQFGQNANKQMSSLSNTISSSMGKIGKLLAGAFAVKAIVNFGKECLQLGSDLQEEQNVVDVTFGDMVESINEFARTSVENFGLSETAAKKYAGVFGAMSLSMGLTRKQALEMSKAVVALTGDVASFYNLQYDVAYTKLKSIWTGETETLKDLGVVMTQVNLKQFALSQGIGKSLDKMTEAEKVMLRYQYVTKALSNTQNDFVNSIDSWANQTRVLSEQFNAFKATIGQGFIIALTPIVKGLNLLMGKLRMAAEYFKAFVELIFGKQSVSGGAGMVDLAEATESITDSASGASDAVEGIGDSAKKAAKKAKGAVASFDELNQLSSTSDSSSSGSSGGSLSSGAPADDLVDLGSVDATSTVLDEFSDKLTEIFEKFKSIDLGPLIESFNKFKEALAPITDKLFAGLLWGIDNVLYPLTKWTIEDVLPAFFNVLAGALKVLNPLLESFKPLASFLWNGFLQPIASWTGGAIVGILEGVAKGLKAVGDWMSEHQELVTAITTTLGLFFGAWKIIELLAFIEMSGGVVKAIRSITKVLKLGLGAKIADKVQTMVLTALYAKDFVVALASSTAALVKQAAQFVISKGAIVAAKIAQVALTVATVAWNTICAIATAVTTAFGAAVAFLTSPIGLVILAIAALVAGIVLLIKNWDTVKAAAIKCWELIKQAWNKAGDWFNTSVVQPVAKFFSGLWNGIKESAANAWQGVCNAWNSAGQWFSTNIIEPIKNKFTTWKTDISNLGAQAWSGVKTGWNNAAQWFSTTIITPIGNAFSAMWNGVKTTCSNVFNSIKSVVKAPLNAVIGMVNTVLKGVNSVTGTLSKLPGVNISTIPQIPKLAKGGVIDNPTIAMVGEAGREVVVPLENNTGWTNEVASLLANALMPFMGVGNNGQNVSLEMDGTTFARTATPYVIKEMKRLGFDF